MRKILFFLIIFIFLLFPKNVFASNPDFDITVNSNYDIKESGITTLTQNVSIRNKTDYNYTPTFSISVGFKNIENIVAFGENGSIPFTLDDTDKDNKNIKLSFEKRYAGLGVVNNFTLKLDTRDITKKRGNVWEISVPGISSPDDFFAYNTTVNAPDSFGEPKIIKPFKNFKVGKITFNKEETGKAGIYLIFGEKQYYSFKLKYNISNPNLFPVKTEISLPPKTNYQNVIITSFSSPPVNVKLDSDKNFIAEYKLFPQQRMTVAVTGVVEVDPRKEEEELTSEEMKRYLKPLKYWEANDDRVLEISRSLKTPQEIYEFVTKTLSYNYDKVTGDNTRLGGKGALETPENSVCLEFTDLFIALSRAKGIPSRAVEGYAYADNSKLRPLSLVEDVLHSWPEYYDTSSKRWIMVDPTWGNTTNGMDYFNTLDFEHIAFVIKGIDSEYPIPAGGYKFDNKSKDVEISFAKAQDFKPKEKLEITDSFASFVFPGLAIEGSFIIKNSGNTLIQNKKVIITEENGEKREYLINELPPGGKKEIALSFGNAPFLTNRTKILKMQIGNLIHKKEIKISFIPDFSFLLIIGGIIGGSIAITIITYYTGSLFIQRRKRERSLRGKSKRR